MLPESVSRCACRPSQGVEKPHTLTGRGGVPNVCRAAALIMKASGVPGAEVTPAVYVVQREPGMKKGRKPRLMFPRLTLAAAQRTKFALSQPLAVDFLRLA